MDWIRKSEKGEISISDLDLFIYGICGIFIFASTIIVAAGLAYSEGRKQGYRAGYKKCRDADDEYINELVRIIDDLGKGKMEKR